MRYIQAKKILSKDKGLNIYRGCTHGCIYCDSRSLCYNIDDFENIQVKENAINLLRKELLSMRNKAIIATGSMSDPYLHLEKQLNMTRQMLETIYELGYGVSVLTKSDLILRDLDLYDAINKRYKAIVSMTITTYDENLCKLLEPNVATTSRRFEVLKSFHERGIQTGIWLGPILPFVNDNPQNIINIVKRAHQVGVSYILVFEFGMTLRDGNREYYYLNLDKLFPGLKLEYEKRYGLSYGLKSPRSSELWKVFIKACEQYGIIYDPKIIFALREFKRQTYEQLKLF